MADQINDLKDAEKAKLNAAFEAEQDTLKAKREPASGEQGEVCFGGWGFSPAVLIALGLIFLVVFANVNIGWWIVPLIFLVMCKSRC